MPRRFFFFFWGGDKNCRTCEKVDAFQWFQCDDGNLGNDLMNMQFLCDVMWCIMRAMTVFDNKFPTTNDRPDNKWWDDTNVLQLLNRRASLRIYRMPPSKFDIDTSNDDLEQTCLCFRKFSYLHLKICINFSLPKVWKKWAPTRQGWAIPWSLPITSPCRWAALVISCPNSWRRTRRNFFSRWEFGVRFFLRRYPPVLSGIGKDGGDHWTIAEVILVVGVTMIVGWKIPWSSRTWVGSQGARCHCWWKKEIRRAP